MGTIVEVIYLQVCWMLPLLFHFPTNTIEMYQCTIFILPKKKWNSILMACTGGMEMVRYRNCHHNWLQLLPLPLNHVPLTFKEKLSSFFVPKFNSTSLGIFIIKTFLAKLSFMTWMYKNWLNFRLSSDE